MSDRLLAWALRGVWVVVPFTVWPSLGAALRHHAEAVRTTAAVGSWVIWGAVVVATLVPHPLGLTMLRCVAPGVLGVSVVAAVVGHPSAWAAALGVGWSVVVAAVAFLAATGILFVNGPAYPNERRFPLAAPGALLVGPVEVAWAVTVGLPSAAALLLADERWLLGGILVTLAVPAVAVLGRALHGLSRRWVVFVPAGLVLRDPMTLVEPVLFRRQVVEGLGPAPAGTDSLDLTMGSIGLALELRLLEKVPMTRAVRGSRRGEEGSSARLLFTPTRPGNVLGYAADHRIPVGATERA